MGRFTLPRDLYYGKDSLENLKNIDGKKAIVVSGGSSMRRGGFLDKVEAYLKEAGMEVQLFEGVEPDPSVETVMKGAKAMTDFQPDVIVAIGGGSPIDAAKAMWAFYEYPEVTFEQLCTPFSFPKLRQKAVGSTVGVAVGVTSPTISLKLRSTFPLAVGAVTVTSYTPSAMSSMYPIVDECFDTLILSVIGAKHILSSAKSPS